MLDFRLYTFLTLSETLNYTKAADILCITQPAVSQHIKYMEKEYDCKLFFYDGKQLNLTARVSCWLRKCVPWLRMRK